MNTEEICHNVIKEAKQGDQSSINQILIAYNWIPILLARRYFIIGGEREDLIQEGNIGLFKAIRDYDPHKGIPFKNFAFICVYRQIITAIKTSTRIKNMTLNNSISLNKKAYEDSDRELQEFISYGVLKNNPEYIYLKREELDNLFHYINTKLTAFEFNIFKQYIKGCYSIKEISEIIGCHSKAVDNAVYRIKKKIKKIREDVYDVS